MMYKRLSFNGVSPLPAPHPLNALSPATVSADIATYAICISPDGTSVYALNNGNSDISQYHRDIGTGLLTPYSPANVVAGLHGTCLAISSDGKSLYAGSCDSTPNGHVYQYTRDISTGLVLPCTPAFITFAITKMSAMVVSPDGKNLYVSCYDGNIYQFSRDTSSGLLTALSTPSITSGSLAGGISISSDGNFIYCGASSSIYQYARDSSTGLLSPLSPATAPAGVLQQGLNAISPDGNFFYSACYGDTNIYQYHRDTNTGLLTPLTPRFVTPWDVPYGIFISPDGKALFSSGYGYNVDQFSRNVRTGKLYAITPPYVSTSSSPAYGITGSTDSTYIYVTALSGIVYQFSRS